MKKNILKLFGIYTLLGVSLMIAGCSSDAVESKHILNGTVTDEFGSPISNVTVVLQSQSASLTAKTDAAGKYGFKDLEFGSYNVSFAKEGFKNETKTIEIIWGRNTEYDCSLKNTAGVVLGGNASVTITDDLAISDGICLWLETSNAKKFYHYCANSDDFAGFSDIEIIKYLIENSDEGYSQPYWIERTPNTNYTVFLVALDAQGRAGALVKKQIKTKPANNQPVADINITSAGGGSLYCDITKNSYCASWSYMCYYNYSDINSLLGVHDIDLAADAYKNSKTPGNIFTSDAPLSFSKLQGFAIIITLGFSSSGENSGIISKKIFDANTGTVYGATSSSVSSQAGNSGQAKMMGRKVMSKK